MQRSYEGFERCQAMLAGAYKVFTVHRSGSSVQSGADIPQLIAARYRENRKTGYVPKT